MTQFKLFDETFEMLDPNRITFAEADAVERLTGHTFSEIQTDEHLGRSVRVVQAMLMISIKRRRPTFTMKDLDDVEVGGIEWIEDETDQEADESADPTLPLGEDADAEQQT